MKKWVTAIIKWWVWFVWETGKEILWGIADQIADSTAFITGFAETEFKE